MKRFVIRDIETKKVKSLNYKKLDFSSFQAAKDFLRWIPFGVGVYYEVYDIQEDWVCYKYLDRKAKRIIKA